MLQMHLRQSEFTNSDCGPFTKNKEGIQKFKEARNSRYIYHKTKFAFKMIQIMKILRIH